MKTTELDKLKQIYPESEEMFDALAAAGWELLRTKGTHHQWVFRGEHTATTGIKASSDLATDNEVIEFATRRFAELPVVAIETGGQDASTPSLGKRTYFTILMELIKDISTDEEFSTFIESHGLQEVGQGNEDVRFNEGEREQLMRSLHSLSMDLAAHPEAPEVEIADVPDEPETTSGEVDEVETTSVPVSEINLTDILIDSTIQSRGAGTDQKLVIEYEAAMRDGDDFPPIRVFCDGERNWLSQGFHRVPAAMRAGKIRIDCEILEGGRREAMLDSIGANAAHGLQRTNADKRKAVTLMLMDEEWVQWSDNAIANVVRVSQPFVAGIRLELTSSNIISGQTERVSVKGTKVKTGNIGRTKVAGLNAVTFNVDDLVYRLKGEADGIGDYQLVEEGFAQKTIYEAQNAHRIELSKNGIYHYRWQTADVVSELDKSGPMFLGELQELGCSTVSLIAAKSEDAVVLDAEGRYSIPGTPSALPTDSPSEPEETQERLPATPSPKEQPRAKERPSIESLLGGKMMKVGLVFNMPKLAGKVSVSVNIGDKPQDAGRSLLDASSMRPLPDALMQLIADQIEHAKPRKTAQKRKPAKKTVARKPPKKAAKSPAKKAVKKPAVKKSVKKSTRARA